MTTYELEFLPSALKEWKKLGKPIRLQLTKKLAKIVRNPHIPAARLSGMNDCYKIKLRKAGYRLVYQVEDERITVVVIAIGKRENDTVYDAAKGRLN